MKKGIVILLIIIAVIAAYFIWKKVEAPPKLVEIKLGVVTKPGSAHSNKGSFKCTPDFDY